MSKDNEEREPSILASAITAFIRTQGEEPIDIPKSVTNSDEFYAWVHKDELPFPADFLEPKWEVTEEAEASLSNWKLLVTDEVEALWLTFTEEQRRKLAANFLSLSNSY